MKVVNNRVRNHKDTGIVTGTETQCPYCNQTRHADNYANRLKNSRDDIVVCANCGKPYGLELMVVAVNAVGIKLKEPQGLWGLATTPILDEDTDTYTLKNLTPNHQFPLWQLVELIGQEPLKKYCGVPVIVNIDAEYMGYEGSNNADWRKTKEEGKEPSQMYKIEKVTIEPLLGIPVKKRALTKKSKESSSCSNK